MRNKFMLLIMLCSLSVQALAQRDNIIGDSLYSELPSLANDYYVGYTYLNHDYRYELVNKKRSFELKAKSMNMLGYLTFMGVMLGFDFMVVGVDDSVGKTVGYSLCSVVIGGVMATPFFLMGNRYHKKADAIDISTSYIMDFNNGKVQLGPSMMRTNNDLCQRQQMGIGLSIKTSF